MMSEVYCICRQGHNSKNGGMIQCGGCLEWFHFRCLNIKEGSVFYHDDKSFPCPFCSSITDKLPDDVMQSILQFDSNRTRAQNRRVSRKWNEISNKIDEAAFRKVKEEIKKRQPKDIKETYLMKQMDLVTDKMYLALKRLDKDIEAIEKNKKRIKAKYKQLVNDLGLLSRYRCNECGINGYDNVRDNRTTCDTCKKEMCDCTAVRCEAGDGCDCASSFCTECELQLKECPACGRALCRYCSELSGKYDQCRQCGGQVCESCVEHREETHYTGGAPWDYEIETQTWCKMCYEYR
eukprot:1048231_1